MQLVKVAEPVPTIEVDLLIVVLKVAAILTSAARIK